MDLILFVGLKRLGELVRAWDSFPPMPSGFGLLSLSLPVGRALHPFFKGELMTGRVRERVSPEGQASCSPFSL